MLTVVTTVKISIIAFHNGPQGTGKSIFKVAESDRGFLFQPKSPILTEGNDTSRIWATKAQYRDLVQFACV